MTGPTVLFAFEMNGTLADETAGMIAHAIISSHQLQQHDDYHMLVILADKALMLDAAAFASVVDHQVNHHPNDEKTSTFLRLQGGLKIKPKPEPEVVNAKMASPWGVAGAPAEPEPDPEPEVVEKPRWKADVKFKLFGGRKFVETHFIDEVEELQDIVESVDFTTIKNIKIKLEYQL